MPATHEQKLEKIYLKVCKSRIDQLITENIRSQLPGLKEKDYKSGLNFKMCSNNV